MHLEDTHVCISKKALYALKRAPFTWYSRIEGYLLTLVFTNIVAYPNLYYLYDKSNLLVWLAYVDDLIFASSYEKLIAWCKKKFQANMTKRTLSLCITFSV